MTSTKKITVDAALLERTRALIHEAVHGYGIECNCGLPGDCDRSCTRASLEDFDVTLTRVISESKGVMTLEEIVEKLEECLEWEVGKRVSHDGSPFKYVLATVVLPGDGFGTEFLGIGNTYEEAYNRVVAAWQSALFEKGILDD